MIIAFVLYAHDDESYMLGPDTYRAPNANGYFDWRFGIDGVPHLATCPTCGRKTNTSFVSENYRVRRRRRDITATYDGYTLASSKFRSFCERHDWSDDIRFTDLPADRDFSVLQPSAVLPFDAERRKTRFEKPCADCGKHHDVVGATPAFLSGISEPIGNGIYRTDIEFGSGHEQRPLIIVGTNTAAMVQELGFDKLDFVAINA